MRTSHQRAKRCCGHAVHDAVSSSHLQESPMSELVVIAFETSTQADAVLDELRSLQQQYLIDLEDAVVAVRTAAGEVRLKQSVNLAAIGAASGTAWGGFWGALVGLVFLNPLAGFAIGGLAGAGAGALSGKLNDYGIN